MMANRESINESTHAKYDPLLQQIFKSINQSINTNYTLYSLLQQIFQINQSMLATPPTNIN